MKRQFLVTLEANLKSSELRAILKRACERFVVKAKVEPATRRTLGRAYNGMTES